jgi:hypothetical protein
MPMIFKILIAYFWIEKIKKSVFFIGRDPVVIEKYNFVF